MALECLPQLGRTIVGIAIKLPPLPDQGSPLADGVRKLYTTGEFVDVKLVVSGQTFVAHRCVLAARSPAFKEALEQGPDRTLDSCQEIQLSDIEHPEAVKFMLDSLYDADFKVGDDYNPRTLEINRDVLQLAKRFKIPELTAKAKQWLAKDLNTGNVMERLAICETFALSDVFLNIMEKLNENKRALAEIAHSPNIVNYPSLMQALLQQASLIPDEAQPKKKARR